jgi:hypothetical protein
MALAELQDGSIFVDRPPGNVFSAEAREFFEAKTKGPLRELVNHMILDGCSPVGA